MGCSYLRAWNHGSFFFYQEKLDMQAGVQKVQTSILKPLLTQQPLEFLLLF